MARKGCTLFIVFLFLNYVVYFLFQSTMIMMTLDTCFLDSPSTQQLNVIITFIIFHLTLSTTFHLHQNQTVQDYGKNCMYSTR